MTTSKGRINANKHDSFPALLLAYELSMEAQRLTFCMATLSAFTEANHPNGIPTRPKGFMLAMSKAIYEDTMNPKEMNPLEW
jgi:hypothetical protein